MNKKVMKMFLSSLLVSMIGMMVGCSVKDDDNYANLNPRADDSRIVGGVYDGEWTVNKQVVDTAQLVLLEEWKMRIRLPESYLLGLLSPDSQGSSVVPGNRSTTIEIYQQGYSEQSQYMSFNSNTLKDKDGKTCYSICSFLATIGGETCTIELLSYENATAVLQNTTGQWTLGIPIGALLIKNQQTGQSTEYRLPIPVILYYNTKKRVG